MDKKIIIANWKSHKNTSDAENFINYFSQNVNRINLDNKKIIIAPSFQLLMTCKNLIEKFNLPISLSSQNVSAFGEGPFTGEVNALQVKEMAEYVIIGHSERRTLLNENDEVLSKKVIEAKKSNLKIIYCIQNSSQKIPNGVEIIAYEPPTAIGSGNPDEPTHIESVFEEVRKRFDGKILYGGSVDEQNVRNFIYINHCAGLLVGGASLEPESFFSLISQW